MTDKAQSKQAITAKDIVRVLADKHADDVFVPECNLGSSWNRCRRIDAWAMKKSWANPCATGYEIKVSRGDFMQDDKWHEYLEHCNEFYWVCPWKMIQPNEVGGGAGLMWVTNTGTRAIRKVKAPHRQIEFPAEVAQYVLMSRAQIVQDMHQANRTTERERWERWLENRIVDQQFGQRVGRAIREQIDREILEARRENAELKRAHKGYDRVREILEALGFDPEHPPSGFGADRRVREQIEKAREVVSQDLLYEIDRTAEKCRVLKKRLAEFRGDDDEF